MANLGLAELELKTKIQNAINILFFLQIMFSSMPCFAFKFNFQKLLSHFFLYLGWANHKWCHDSKEKKRTLKNVN